MFNKTKNKLNISDFNSKTSAGSVEYYQLEDPIVIGRAREILRVSNINDPVKMFKNGKPQKIKNWNLNLYLRYKFSSKVLTTDPCLSVTQKPNFSYLYLKRVRLSKQNFKIETTFTIHVVNIVRFEQPFRRKFITH